jgi:hypothetical protein
MKPFSSSHLTSMAEILSPNWVSPVHGRYAGQMTTEEIIGSTNMASIKLSTKLEISSKAAMASINLIYQPHLLEKKIVFSIYVFKVLRG